ncbi:MAG: 30S ribosomal protein S18 [Candidatus Marinimicrobia bacterium]|jgi:small subunit ribosomal protein S18|nr:30S ribosomal protein S18 [Candidatus Neomarinimicrobiota bacterium]MAG20909.1 30S ribosomal protein S18 [Candidatus Neomarinimicrobiota bacterium]MDP6456882.1 30S ribosomal protein S18 [Candidatus Neomarinimicrobiota bacterium]MDP6593861.1 30S ribosomal protein S18 [Candidatus Neomarinimicrobiota bacterium]MDP6835901.1 30S ribosomal protein S18 [Candidatus Neomarinimicrobiota bacterium]
MAIMGRRRVCKFCEDRALQIDYKNVKLIRKFVTEQGKIIPGRVTGTCARHQRTLTTAIKRARNIALLSPSG